MMKLPKLPPLKKEHKLALKVLFIIVLFAACVAVFSPAQATNNHDINIDIDVNDHEHEYNNDTNGCLCVSGGLSDGDLSRGLSLAMSAGAHELDWGTTDYQASVTYAMQVNEDEEGAYSVKLGKKWNEIPALFHVTYVPEQGQDYGDCVIFGGTIRF